ncbi:MAG: hypothetical protein ACYDAG_07585 [Chloroflexota bacterium]
MLPSRESIAASFVFDWIPSYLAPSAEMAEDAALAEKIRQESQIEADLLRMRQSNIRFQEDFAYEEKRLELARIRDERAQEEQLSREIYQAKRKKHMALVDGTFAELSCQLRELVYGVCLDVLAGLKRNGKVIRNSSKQIHNLIEKLKLLNVADDEEIAAISRQMEAIFTSRSEVRDTDAIAGVLREIGIVTRSQLSAAGRNPRSGADAGIPDDLGSFGPRSARRLEFLPAEHFELPTVVRRARRLSETQN